MFELFPASPTWEWLWCSLTSFPQCIHTYNTAPNPLPRYVSVDSITNPETILVFQLVAKLTGQNTSYEDCSQCLSNCYNTTVDQVCCIVLRLSVELSQSFAWLLHLECITDSLKIQTSTATLVACSEKNYLKFDVHTEWSLYDFATEKLHVQWGRLHVHSTSLV